MGIGRNLDSDFLTDLSGVFNPVILVHVDWPGDPVHVHSGVGDITFDGETWVGLGKYGNIALPGEELSIVNEKATLSISGTLADLLAELNSNPRNKDVEIYFGSTTLPAGNVLVGQPSLMFAGFVDTVDFALEKEGTELNSTVFVGVSTGPSARARATINHTAEDQAYKYPGDTAGRQLINQNKKTYNPDVWPEP